VTLAPSNCPNCDAQITREATQFCTYCGTQLPHLELSRPATLEERFAALEAHADYADLLAQQPSVKTELQSHTMMIVFLVVFVLMGLPILGVFFVVGFASGPFLPLFMLIPMAVVGLGIYLLVKTARSASAFKRAKLSSWPGHVVDERTKVSGGGDNRRASTTYFVTLQDSAGRRREFRARGPVAGEIGTGDMGVAYSKAEFLIDFMRVEV